ncbi:MAG: hypothetical protein ACRCXC_00630 [Legionella sp.]
MALTKQILEQAGAVYHIAQELFVDFSTSRNLALTLAEAFFPQIPFILMPDVEWRLMHAERLLDFCKTQLETSAALFMIRIVMNNPVDFGTSRLFRAQAKIRFVGAVH